MDFNDINYYFNYFINKSEKPIEKTDRVNFEYFDPN